MRHQLRRWQALTKRITRGIVKVKHLPDIEMPVDYLTKWVSKKKVDASVAYLTNALSTACACLIRPRRRCEFMDTAFQA